MPVTQVSICNLALIEVGADLISSISQDTKSARLLNAIWDQSRDQVLHDHRWKFAEKRDVLAPTGTAPEFGYAYAYDIPNDCIKIWEVDTDEVLGPDDVEWKREGNQILTDESSINVLYVYRHEDYNAWPATFAEAMALKLAAQIAYGLTQSLSLRESLEKKYKEKLALARSFSSTEGLQQSFIADEWTNARR